MEDNANPITLSSGLAFGVLIAAQQLGVSPQFVRLEIARGKIKVARLGRRVVISRTELLRYLADAQDDAR